MEDDNEGDRGMNYREHWEGVKSGYVFAEYVHDLGHGHKEILVQRMDRYAKRPPEFRSYDKRSAAEVAAANAQRAARRAKTEVRTRCKAMGLDTMLTLTYRANQTDEALCKEHMKEFIRRLRVHLPAFVYVAAFERQKHGAWHVHLAVRRVQSHLMVKGVRVKSYNLLRSVWRSVVGVLGGNVDISAKLKSSRKTGAQIASYISKYMVKAYAEGEKYTKRYTCSRFRMPPRVMTFSRGQCLLDRVQALVEQHAPAGTRIRCHLVDDNRGFFFTVEPDCPSCYAAPEKAKPQSWDRDNCGFGASIHNSEQGVSHGMA